MFIFDYELNTYTEYNMLLTTLFQAIGIFLTIKYLDKTSINPKNIYYKIKNNIIGKAIVSISICSYGMYFAHYIVIEYFDISNIHSLKLLPVLLIVTIVISWLSTYLISKIPHLKKFSGA